MDNNFLALTEFGIFHIYYADTCIHIRKYDGTKWSVADTVITDAVNDFDVCYVKGCIYLLCEKTNGSLYYATYTKRSKSAKNIMASKSGRAQITNIKLVAAGERIHAFYVLNHEEQSLLVHHYPSSSKTPGVIAKLSGGDYLLQKDISDNINIFFSDFTGNMHLTLKPENAFAVSGPSAAVSTPPIALCYLDKKMISISNTDGKIRVHTDFDHGTVLSAVAGKPKTEVFCFDKKIYVVLWTLSSVNVFVSDDDGKSFSRLPPQTFTRMPRIKMLKIRGEDKCFVVPCNAERGYVRSMVIPFEKIVGSKKTEKETFEDVENRIKFIEREILDIKKKIRLGR